MSIVSVPERHICDGLSGRVNGAWHYPDIQVGLVRFPDGTIRRCDSCGTTWVAGRIPGDMANVWRREGRLERWMREQKRKP